MLHEIRSEISDRFSELRIESARVAVGRFCADWCMARTNAETDKPIEIRIYLIKEYEARPVLTFAETALQPITKTEWIKTNKTSKENESIQA